ncbi:MAG: tetratricopeptide repeat protein [Anaerolineae bacterium]|nr:tetratricopeptide repeat protein [Anaerolineae bacterium]
MSTFLPVATLIEESLALERSGEIAAALRKAREALERARALGEPEAIAAALTCLGFLQFRIGAYDEARGLARDALIRAPGDSQACADALLLLGMCATETNDLATGEEYYRRAIQLSRQLGYDRALLRGLHNMAAAIYMPRGQFELALAADAEALRLAYDRGMPELAPPPLIMRAWVYWLSGRRERAYATVEELERIAGPGSMAKGYAWCIRANLALDEGFPEKAQPLYAHARSIAEATGAPDLNINVRLGLSRFARATGDAATAHAWANDAFTLASRVGYCHFQGLALVERGRAAWARGDCTAAEADFREAITIMTPLGVEFDLARATLLLAALLHAQERRETAAVWADAAQRIAQGGYAFLLEQERALAFPLVAACLGSPDPEIKALSTTLLAHLARVPPPPLRVFTLGRFEVWQGTRRIEKHAWSRRRAGELFRLLLISPRRSLFREQVFEALWPEKEPEAAQECLHQATSALRRALEPDLPDRFPSRYLKVEEGVVTLQLPPGSWIDFEAFEQHIRAKEWENALALFEGEPFPDDRYADWAAIPCRRLRECFLEALLAVAQAHLNAGRPHEALEACRRVLAVDAWQEEAVRLGMLACLALNDRAGALRLYRDLERTLHEDLDVAPQAELRKLYHNLLG